MINVMLDALYKKDAVSRALWIWLGFSVALWSFFGFAYFTHPQAWSSVEEVRRQTGWSVFWTILASNSLLILLIVAGNLFVRFGVITPGLIILAIQAVIIGWTAGTNGFMEPFATLNEANAAFLRIGFWETGAYALLCAVTLPKSLLVSKTFPAREWVQQHKLKDLYFTKDELVIAACGMLCLFGSAFIEAFLPK